MRDQRRTRPTGMEAPPTIMPRTVRSQVRFIEAAFRMQQNLTPEIALVGVEICGRDRTGEK
jgi:hypothetical protein